MLAKTTISGQERAVLRRAVLADLPTVEEVLAAYEDVDQRHARELHHRFTNELALLDALGWRAGPAGEHRDLYCTDASLIYGLEVLYARASITVRDHLPVVDDRPSRLLEASLPVLRQLAVAAAPRPHSGGVLGEQLLRGLEAMHETVLLLPGHAEPIRDALRADLAHQPSNDAEQAS